MPPTIFLEDEDLIPTTSFEPINYKVSLEHQNSPIGNVSDNFGSIVLNNNTDNVSGINNYVKEFFAADNPLFRPTENTNVNF